MRWFWPKLECYASKKKNDKPGPPQ